MMRRIAIVAAMIVVAVAVWFMGVDDSWFDESCPYCRHGRQIYQRRVFGLPIAEGSREYEAIWIERVAADLGIPCVHPDLVRTHEYRRWGLCFLTYPCGEGNLRLGGGSSWYDESVAQKVRAMVTADPTLPAEFRKRVMTRQRDWEYCRALYTTLRSDDASLP